MTQIRLCNHATWKAREAVVIILTELAASHPPRILCQDSDRSHIILPVKI
jgi:hypothetical protein